MGKFANHYIHFVAVAVAVIVFSLVFPFNIANNVLAGYEEGDVSGGGSITGAVKLAGDAPGMKMLKVDKDQKTCGHDEIPSEALIVSSSNGIKNAVVSISNISKGKKFDRSGNASIDQKGCVFNPHVSVVPPGSAVNLMNSDDVMHNLHSWSMKNTAFNEGVAGGGKLPKKFEYPETIKITCDVHKWMTAWLVVEDNPYYAITGENGSYKIDDVPPGTYTLQVWQESLGKSSQEVTVKAGGETKIDFEIQQKEKRARRKER